MDKTNSNTKILVSETINTKGWTIIEDEIKLLIQYAQAKLEITDPTMIVEIAKMQERISVLKKTLQIVHNMVI